MTLPPETDAKFFSRDSGNEVVFLFVDKTTTMDLGSEQKAVRQGHDYYSTRCASRSCVTFQQPRAALSPRRRSRRPARMFPLFNRLAFK